MEELKKNIDGVQVSITNIPQRIIYIQLMFKTFLVKKIFFKQIYKILKFLKLNNSKTFDTNIFDNLFLKTNSFKNKPFHMKKDKIILLCNNSQIRLINKKNLQIYK